MFSFGKNSSQLIVQLHMMHMMVLIEVERTEAQLTKSIAGNLALLGVLAFLLFFFF